MSLSFAAGASPLFLSSPPSGSAGPLLEPGTTLERFRLIRHLGSGRGAHVYLAHDAQRGHEVAVKVADLRPDAAQSVAGRMQREIDIRHCLGTHPHVLSLFDAHQIQVGGLDLLVLSMEYADGGDFRQYLQEPRLNPGTQPGSRFAPVLDAARGLAALHRTGMVHLDFKPDNLLCVRGVWKLADFDHTRRREELAGQNLREGAGNPAADGGGTPGYQSPEATSPNSGTLDSRADIFSLGVVLREVSTIAGLTGTCGRRSRGPHKPPRIRAILKRCLQTDPSARFQLVDHVIEALESELRPDPRRRPQGNWPRQHRQWRHACRCLAGGRVRDARRLCQILLHDSPHHPGAGAVLTELDRQARDVLERARQQGEVAESLALQETLALLRELVELTPHEELTTRLLGSVEQQVGQCESSLVQALTGLSAGAPQSFASAVDEASARHPGDSIAADASLRARDLVDQLAQSAERISEAVAHRRFRQALNLIHRHRRCLAQLRKRGPRILACLQAGRQNTEGAEDVLEPQSV